MNPRDIILWHVMNAIVALALVALALTFLGAPDEQKLEIGQAGGRYAVRS